MEQNQTGFQSRDPRHTLTLHSSPKRPVDRLSLLSRDAEIRQHLLRRPSRQQQKAKLPIHANQPTKTSRHHFLLLRLRALCSFVGHHASAQCLCSMPLRRILYSPFFPMFTNGFCSKRSHKDSYGDFRLVEWGKVSLDHHSFKPSASIRSSAVLEMHIATDCLAVLFNGTTLVSVPSYTVSPGDQG